MNRLIRYPRALVILCVLLLLSNVGLVVLFLSGKRSGKGSRGGSSIEERVRKEVGFSEAQSAQFHQLMEENRNLMNEMGESARSQKKEFYELLFRDSVSESQVLQSAMALSDRQRSLDLQLFHHFQQVRALCDEQQRRKYDSIIMRVTSRAGGFRGRGRGN